MLDKSSEFIASKLGISNYTAGESGGCILFRTKERDFRVHVRDETDLTSAFEQILLEAFANELRDLGVDRTCTSFASENKLFIVEESQKLQVADRSRCSIEEAVRSALVATRNVEKNLLFPQIVAQLKQRFGTERLQDLRIASYEKPRYSDFAIFEGQVVPINVSNRFLALIGPSNTWANDFTADCFVVETAFGKFIFGPKHICRDKTEQMLRLTGSVSEWWLFPFDAGESLMREREAAENDLRQMQETNVKIMTQKQPFPVCAVSLSVDEERRYS